MQRPRVPQLAPSEPAGARPAYLAAARAHIYAVVEGAPAYAWANPHGSGDVEYVKRRAAAPIESDAELDERITALRATGMSLPRIARHLMIPLHELHKRIDALLPDASYQRRAIAESLTQIDAIGATHMKTISDPESASVVIRSVCERRALLRVTGSISLDTLSNADADKSNH